MAYYVVDEHGQKAVAYTAEQFLSLLAQAIEEGTIEGIVADTAFLNKIKCCVNEETLNIAFVTSAQYNALVAQGLIDPDTVYFVSENNVIRTFDASTLNKQTVGLGNVDNTSDTDKPISTATQAALNAINALIPAQASASNELADKNFVNSSIATNTANYISNNGEPFTSVVQLNAYSGTVTNNDYAFVTGTESGNTYYDRYKATVNGSTVTWAKEFRLNNSSFTAVQWAAINSGITAALVAQISANQTAIAGKAPAYQYSTTDIGVGANLNTGTLYFVYEA